MSKGWTEERRLLQAERARKNKPWQHSTGPRSVAGKARSRHNAFKHGFDGISGQALRRLLRHNRDFVREANFLMRNSIFSPYMNTGNELKKSSFFVLFRLDDENK